MIRVARSTVLEAPIEAVWGLLRDFNGHDRWHPAVAVSSIGGGRAPDRVGAVRRFRLASGEWLSERLLTLSDRAHRLRYTIVESEVPLLDYAAEVELKPVTDRNATFWRWSSRFRAPEGREDEMARLFGEGVYVAGFEGLRARLAPARSRARPAAPVATGGAALPGTAISVSRHGGPEVLVPVATEAPPPGPGEVRLRQSEIGVNYIDVYCRTGYFPLVAPPGVPGMEAAGEVVDVGPGVTHLRPGDRVGYACAPPGAYATVRTMKADLVVGLPPGMTTRAAAGGLLKGITAWFLTHEVHAVARGETVLVYAPAGGVGRMLVQWCAALGATVIGATGTPAKVAAARAAGAAHVVTPRDRSLEAQVLDLTGGRGADVIFDAVGADTWEHSLAALATRGHLVSFGQASGDIGARPIGSLASKSVTLSRPNYGHYTDTREKVERATGALFEALASGRVTVEIGQRLPLSEAAAAHRSLEARETTGSTILTTGDPS